ncbi:hypothetical protein QC762_306760 [Podospora pseudocomata]|uniref:DUF7598 domain-containing protein n=1 Tax=Podospora pseudocomata TaxID=2093779 RepID=A0ABR0GK12_9PEZI|nr:hypothetical protein QC762_306760 [Podospora pseudocomata]
MGPDRHPTITQSLHHSPLPAEQSANWHESHIKPTTITTIPNNNNKMLSLATSPKLRGSGHLILHALRAMTLVALVVIMASCWAMIVLSGITGHFQFFDVISHFFVFAISIVLFISEIGLFKPWFKNNFPILGPDHSLGWLGLALMITGCGIMADLVKPAYSIDNLGLPIWRLVLSSGILAITFGVFNMIASVVFRDGENGITARNIRSDGSLAVPTNQNSKEYYDSGYQSSVRSNSIRQHQQHYPEDDDNTTPQQSQPFYKRMTNHFSVPIPPKFNFRKSRGNLQISKPMPIHDDNDDVERGTGYGNLNRSNSNSRASPVIPDIQRPPTALHPAYTGGSHYSTAHMDRF